MARIGYTTCGLCRNHEATVSETATGTLSITCHKCELSGYAKKGSKASRLIRANLRADEDIDGTDTPQADPAAQAPAIKPGFSLGSV